MNTNMERNKTILADEVRQLAVCTLDGLNAGEGTLL